MNKKIMVTVIIPTMASLQRASMLERAIASIRRSSSSPVQIIIVVNGKKYDDQLCEWLKSQADIQFDYLEAPSAPQAVLRGRELVTTPYFSTLDDDDEFFEGAIDLRLRLMEADLSMDVVVTNGYRSVDCRDVIIYKNLADVPENPIQSLMNINWLSSCNALYRTLSIEREYFIDSHPYGEWTWLAYKLAMAKKKIGISNEATFRINDTLGSLSKSEYYKTTYLLLFERMLECSPPRDVARLIRRKRGAAWHDASDVSLNNGHRMEAFKYHLRSLFEPGGLKYLGNFRKFLMPQ